MAEFVSMSMITGQAKAAFAEMDRVTDKSTLYALRASGRLIVRKAKAKAPVYNGTDPRAMAESGNLKKSISNSRTIVHLGVGDHSMKVGPFGRNKAGTGVARHGTGVSAGTARAAAVHGITLTSRKAGTSTKGQVRGVPLYRAAMEEKYGFMASGLSGAEAEMRKVYEDAMAKAYERFK